MLPESQVMRLLEEKRGDPLNTTSTPAAFAIQLQWSVQAIDLAQVPPLAIFGAYTLYTVEGSREGRKWFGLRLGFFSDANSAKTGQQQYVRSEFASVAVVPVSLQASVTAPTPLRVARRLAYLRPATTEATIERLPDQSGGEFKLLEDTAARCREVVAPPGRGCSCRTAPPVPSAAVKVQAAKSKAAAAAKLPAGRTAQKASAAAATACMPARGAVRRPWRRLSKSSVPISCRSKA